MGAGQCGYPPSTSVVCTGYLNYCGCPEHAFNCWNRSQFLITAPLTKDSLDHWKGLSIDWTLEFLFIQTPPCRHSPCLSCTGSWPYWPEHKVIQARTISVPIQSWHEFYNLLQPFTFNGVTSFQPTHTVWTNRVLHQDKQNQPGIIWFSSKITFRNQSWKTTERH